MLVKGIEEIRPALIAIGFLSMPALLFDFQINIETILAGFFATFAVYLADHRLPAKDKITWPFILGFSTAFGLFTWLSHQFSLPGILFYVILTFLYVLPIFPEKNRLQDFPRLRIIAIVGGWAGVPLLLQSFPHGRMSVIYLGGMCAFMLPAVLWSDLADAQADHASGRLTWSMRLGERKRAALILFSLTFSALCFSPPHLRPMLPAPLLYLASFRYLNRHPHYSDWILLWPLLGSMGKHL